MEEMSYSLPAKQKVLIGFTGITGLLLMGCSTFNWLQNYLLNLFIISYGIGIPFLLLCFDTVIDLKDRKIFIIWMGITFITFFISVTIYNNEKFEIIRRPEFDPTIGVNRLLARYSTSSLKALLIFLIVYWPINKLLNRKGQYLINTGRQRKWYHKGAQRTITALDVLMNIILYVTIIIAGIFGP